MNDAPVDDMNATLMGKLPPPIIQSKQGMQPVEAPNYRDMLNEMERPAVQQDFATQNMYVPPVQQMQMQMPQANRVRGHVRRAARATVREWRPTTAARRWRSRRALRGSTRRRPPVIEVPDPHRVRQRWTTNHPASLCRRPRPARRGPPVRHGA